jgi:hypothetical protein
MCGGMAALMDRWRRRRHSVIVSEKEPLFVPRKTQRGASRD